MSKTLKKYREKGREGLIPQTKGRRFGTQRILNQEQDEARVRQQLDKQGPGSHIQSGFPGMAK